MFIVQLQNHFSSTVRTDDDEEAAVERLNFNPNAGSATDKSTENY